MDLGLKDKVALIGGSSKGLGRGCARSLAQAGVKLALCARGKEDLYQTAEKINTEFGVEVLPIVADWSSMADIDNSVQQVLKKFGRIDILIVNSGGPQPGGFFDITDEQWHAAYQSVLFYVIKLYQLVIPHMKKQKWGRIINITSFSVKEPVETLILSNVFRAGVVSVAKTLSRELIKDNITINNVCPGAFKTDRAKQLLKNMAEKEGKSVDEVEIKVTQQLPLGRYQTEQEMGDLVAFFSSEAAKGITGTTMPIDGGMGKGLL